MGCSRKITNVGLEFLTREFSHMEPNCRNKFVPSVLSLTRWVFRGTNPSGCCLGENLIIGICLVGVLTRPTIRLWILSVDSMINSLPSWAISWYGPLTEASPYKADFISTRGTSSGFALTMERTAGREFTHNWLAREKLNEILSTMTESIELVETIPALLRLNVDIPKELLRRAFSGPADTSREDDTSNEARNAMFELGVAAMAARRGLTPTLSNTNPDVSFEFESRQVKIECKRILSVNRIMERLRQGTKQLEKSVQGTISDIGIVAISLSKLVNLGDRLLVSDSPHDDLSLQLQDALKSNEQQIGRMHRPWVSGFIFYVSSAAYVPGMGYTPTNSATVFPLNLAEQAFLSRLAHTLYV
jgi:hypothetical protein